MQLPKSWLHELKIYLERESRISHAHKALPALTSSVLKECLLLSYCGVLGYVHLHGMSEVLAVFVGSAEAPHAESANNARSLLQGEELHRPSCTYA